MISATASWIDQYKVDVPEGEKGPWRVEKFEIKADDPEMFIFNLQAGSRGVRPGHYTRLMRGSTVVMSDTYAEIRDHIGAIQQIGRPDTRSVLIHGLGLGMVLQAALKCPHVERVDVVEISQDVIDLVGPHYARMAERLDQRGRVMAGERRERLKIWHGNAYDFEFTPGLRWDVAWHDIWDDISADNLDGMARLNRRYGHRVNWQGCWGQAEARESRRRWG